MTISLPLYDCMKEMIQLHYLRTIHPAMLESLGHMRYAREYLTLRINPGRQTGKSTLLVEMYHPSDIVVVKNSTQSKNLQEMASVPLVMISLSQLKSDPQEYACNRLWVNDADCMTSDEIDMIYDCFAKNAKQIILLG